jgi:hypothetical protein
MKIVQCELFHADRETGRQTNREFRTFANAHKNDKTEIFEGPSDKLNVSRILSTRFFKKIHE